jgi:hypothetical protein
MSYKNPISSSDPAAIEKLTEKLEQCRQLQAAMKEVNAYWRKNGTCVGAPGVTETQAVKLDASIERAYSWNKQPFPSYDLSNNNAEIKRLEKRIDEIALNREVGFTGWEFAGGRAVANTEIDRLQLLFDEKPSPEQRDVLKHKGFHWSPRNEAWQRQLTKNAIYAVNYVDFLRPLDARMPSDLQPKAPKQDRGAR